jgi:mutator protein MutT
MSKPDKPQYVPVVAAIMLRDGKVLLAQRPAGTRNAGKWEFPGGKVEPGEERRVALQRELEEEFGIDATVGEFAGEIDHVYPHIAISLMAYEVRQWDGELVPAEHQAVVWVDWGTVKSFDLAQADRRLLESMDQPC